MRMHLDLKGPFEAVSTTLTVIKAWCKVRGLTVELHQTSDTYHEAGHFISREIELLVQLREKNRQTDFFEVTKRACELTGITFTLSQNFTDQILTLHGSSYALHNNSSWPVVPTDRGAKITSDLG